MTKITTLMAALVASLLAGCNDASRVLADINSPAAVARIAPAERMSAYQAVPWINEQLRAAGCQQVTVKLDPGSEQINVSARCPS